MCCRPHVTVSHSSPVDKSPESRWAVRKEHRNQVKIATSFSVVIRTQQGSPLILIFQHYWRAPTVVPRLHPRQLSDQLSPRTFNFHPYPPSTSNRYQHSFCHSLHMNFILLSKPTQHFFIHTFTTSLSIPALIRTSSFSSSIHSCHSYKTSQTLHLNNILFFLLSTSHTPCIWPK